MVSVVLVYTYLRSWFNSETSVRAAIPRDQISQTARAICKVETPYTVGSGTVLATMAEKVNVMRVIM